MKKVRDSNFELMRIVSMIFIIFWHVIVHGHIIVNCQNSGLRIIFTVTQYVIVVHVNSFVLLMGYYQSQSHVKIRKIVKLILQVIFYSIIFILVGIKLGWVKEYNSVTFLNSIIPSGAMSDYWFIVSYLIVYSFSDIINKYISNLSKKEFQSTILILLLMLSIVPFFAGNGFFFNNGYNFYSFIVLYLIGTYLRIYPLKESYYFKRISLNGYRFLIIIVFCVCAYLNYSLTLFGDYVNGSSNIMSFIANKIFASKLAYSTPFAILQTIAYFEFFKYLNFKSKLVNYVSGSVFGIYLFHENFQVKTHIYKLLGIDKLIYSYKFVVIVLFGIFIIFIMGLLIDKIRLLLIKCLKKIPIYKKMNICFRNYVNSFNIKINW